MTKNSDASRPDDDDRDLSEEDELAPEEAELEDWLPVAEPTDGTAPAP